MEQPDWVPLREAHFRLPRAAGVYVIRHRESHMEYVGISKDVRRRVMRHRTRQAKESRLYRALVAHGLDAFDAAVLQLAPESELPDLEIAAIAARGSFTPRGYNLTQGGGIIHTETHSAERRARAAETARRTHLGRKRSELTKERLSLSLRGRVPDPEVVRRVAEALRGHVMPETTRAAIRASRLRAVLVWRPGSLTPVEFQSVNDAVAFTGLPHATFMYALRHAKSSKHGFVAAYAE